MKILGSLIISMFISLLIFCIKGMTQTDSKRIKLVKKAIQNNHVFRGKLVETKRKRYYDTELPENSYTPIGLIGIYEYEYNGKKYHTKVFEKRVEQLPNEMDLFYIKNPRKATSEYNLGKENNFMKYFIITFGIILIIMYI